MVVVFAMLCARVIVSYKERTAPGKQRRDWRIKQEGRSPRHAKPEILPPLFSSQVCTLLRLHTRGASVGQPLGCSLSYHHCSWWPPNAVIEEWAILEISMRLTASQRWSPKLLVQFVLEQANPLFHLTDCSPLAGWPVGRPHARLRRLTSGASSTTGPTALTVWCSQ